jgi:hypothetical protein
MYAIGIPGAQPRIILITTDYDKALAKCREGEVAINVANTGDFVIDVDGFSVSDRVKSLEELKEIRWLEAKKLRDSAIDGGCNVPGVGIIDSDEISRQNVNGIVTAAMIAKSASQPLNMNWKLKDNSLVAMNADSLISMGMVLASFVAGKHAVAQTLFEAIRDAPDDATLNLIDIDVFS